MRILAVESSAVSASAAILEEDKLISEYFINNKLTHSQTLMPLIEHSLDTAEIPLDSIDAFAVSVGPGSFTGIRIGISSIKGLAFASGKPCIPVSTLEAISQNLSFTEGLLCPVMDARCNQVYNAVFRSNGERIERLREDRAISINDLKEELQGFHEPVWLVGDGACLCYDFMQDLCDRIKLAPLQLRFQRASGVALAAAQKYKKNEGIAAGLLNPIYLRPSQAERELKKRQGESVS